MPPPKRLHPNDPHKDRCADMIAKLSDYIDNDLDEAMHVTVKNHARACPQCTIFLKMLQRTIDLCKYLEARPLSESFSQKLSKKSWKMLYNTNNLE